MARINDRLFMNNSNSSRYIKEEDKVIQEALTTPYEKVMKILRKVQTFLGSNELAKEVKWVIQIINSQKLYSYQGLPMKTFDTNNKNNSFELKYFLGFLDAYSEGTNIFTNHLVNKRSYTTNQKREFLNPLLFKMPQQTDIFEEESSNIEDSNFLVFDEKSDDSIEKDKYDLITKLDQQSNETVLSDQQLLINGQKITHFSINELNKLENTILDFHFNPFEFYEKQGKDNAFFTGAYCLFSKFGIQKHSSEINMQNFILAIKQGYSSVPYYHTEMHGLDICQTVSMYLTQTNIRKNLQMTHMDVVSLIIAALVHDVGHPGYNNDYQVKMQTDLAINYNDKNVLENYHTALTFQIIKNDVTNIFSKLDHDDFQFIRKRMIELILSTDMLFHSRICALIKNRLEQNQILNGNNCENLISSKSDSLFDDQQEVLNLIIHTADISHTSKDFSVSYKWTELLSEEFWRQGDDEKKKGFKVSFLFDRTYSEIPKSQIGFIKGIILPLFDLIRHILPELKIYYDNVQINLKEWTKLSNEKDKDKKLEKNNKTNNF